MTLDHTKKKLNKDLSKSRIGIVLKTLEKILKEDSPLVSQTILISARFSTNKRSYHSGEKPLSVYEEEEQHIVEALHDTVSELEEASLIHNYSLELGGIDNPILVVCFDEEKKNEMIRFFSPLIVTNVTIEKVDKYSDSWNKKYDITIWDNSDLPKCPDEENTSDLREWEMELLSNRELFLKECLDKNPSPHFIHLGEPYYFVQDNRHRVYAANSEYSLFARIQEMIAYIRAHDMPKSSLSAIK